MSNDRKNVFSLVDNKELEKRAALRKKHFEKLLSRIDAGDNYILICVDKEGYTEFLTDMDLLEANFNIDKVKMNLVLGPEDGDDD